jgi:uncharacterized membrane protein YkoI
MTKLLTPITFVFAVMAAGLPAASAQARRGDDQAVMRVDLQEGKVKKIREIEAIVLPRMRGMQYLGFEYDSLDKSYRLKFIDRDRVIFVDVDARSGEILRQQ